MSHLGVVQNGLGHGDAAVTEGHQFSLGEGHGVLHGTHPQFGALQVNDQMGLHPGGLCGGPVDPLEQMLAVGQSHMGQVQPHAGHTGGKEGG